VDFLVVLVMRNTQDRKLRTEGGRRKRERTELELII
jgi:hypothetical protein